MKVEDVMSVNPLYVGAGEHVTRAREIMRDNAIQCLPVLRAGKYEGMVTIQDIINVTSTKSDVTVEGYLRREVPSVSPSTDLAKAARAIIGTEEGRMAVLDGRREAGGHPQHQGHFQGHRDAGHPRHAGPRRDDAQSRGCDGRTSPYRKCGGT